MKLSRTNFKTAKNARYPDNTSGAIQPSDNRNQHEDTADSLLFIVDDIGAGDNTGSGGKSFPEALTDGAAITWNLENRINGMAKFDSATSAIALTLNNFLLGTERILRIKKTISGDITLTLSSGDSIPFFDFYGNAVSNTILLSGATNSYWLIHFRNFGDQIFWFMEVQ